MNWLEGRQGTGYYKLKIFESKLLKMDIYLLKFPKGSKIDRHIDPVPEGYEHHRFNAILKRPKEGGECIIAREPFNFRPQRNRFIKFRPDIMQHYVSRISEGTRYVLSIGWLKKS